jgi:hypothetical protein
MPDPKKETKRERREVARQRRMEEIRRRERKARMRKMLVYSVVALAIVGLVGGILAARAGSNRNKKLLEEAAKKGGCLAVESFPNEVTNPSNSHKPPYKYKTNPPTSGNHNPSPANTGILGPVPDENLVHNLEHGHVIFWYKSELEASLITALQNLVKKDPTHYIMEPRENMDVPLAFSAWTKSQKCPSPRAASIATAEVFANKYKGKGPEDLPGQPVGV